MRAESLKCIKETNIIGTQVHFIVGLRQRLAMPPGRSVQSITVIYKFYSNQSAFIVVSIDLLQGTLETCFIEEHGYACVWVIVAQVVIERACHKFTGSKVMHVLHNSI